MTANHDDMCGHGPLEPKYPDNNPKSAAGHKKLQIGLIPSAGIIEQAKAMEFGAYDHGYGPYNWRGENVTISTMVYINAMLRHLYDYIDGEDLASDSAVNHLGHIAACCDIILDAKVCGNLIDDRPPKGKAAELIEGHKK